MLLFGIFVFTVLFYITWVSEDNKKYLEELAANNKKKGVKEVNKKKTGNSKTKKFYKRISSSK